jgi:glutathione S-transferase
MERLRTSVERSESWISRQMRKVHAGLELMDRGLGANPWCAGTGYSLADIAVGSCLGWLLFRFPELGWQEDRLNLARHYVKLSERASFIDTAPHE